MCSNTQPKKEIIDELPITPTPVPSPPPPPQHPFVAQTQQNYIHNNLTAIQKALQENLYYPRKARKRGIEGEVVVLFHLDTQAHISDIKVLKTPHAILSRGAIRTLEDISGCIPKPQEELDIKVPIVYRLHR